MENRTIDPHLLWDRQLALPLGEALLEDDLLLLLTPVAIPVDDPSHESRDPFEPLGHALSSFHPAVRHVPYTKNGGITEYHEDFIQRCAVIVFVMSGPPGPGEPSQVNLAKAALSMNPDSTFIVIACFDCLDYDLPVWQLPTVIRMPGYTTTQLQTAAHFLFDTPDPSPELAFEDVGHIVPRPWHVESFSLDKDMATISNLWNDCLPARFHTSQSMLRSLLVRDSVLCLVVRQPITKDVLGFCVILTAEDDLTNPPRFGSLAALVVQKEYRGRGIGMSLHYCGIRVLAQTSGIQLIRLGSTFPRLLHGMPDDCRFAGWFNRRGWQDNYFNSSKSLAASDWLLNLNDITGEGLSPSGLSFKRCTTSDRDKVLNLVSRVSRRKGNVGWLPQYTRLASSTSIGDIIVGFEGATVVSAAILYMPSPEHPFVQDMPWAQSIGPDVGGLSCVCIIDQVPGMVNNRESIVKRLLVYCVKTLEENGFKRMFLDAARGRGQGFPALGFRQWARYNDLWMAIGMAVE